MYSSHAYIRMEVYCLKKCKTPYDDPILGGDDSITSSGGCVSACAGYRFGFFRVIFQGGLQASSSSLFLSISRTPSHTAGLDKASASLPSPRVATRDCILLWR